MVVTNGWGNRGNGKYLMGLEFQFFKMKNSGDLFHKNVNILNIVSCIIKND